MQIHCFNIERAVTHLEKSSDENAKHFINVLKEHAVDQDVRITFNQGNLVSMTFTSTHEVDEEIDAGESVIFIHSVDNAATATVSSSNSSPSFKETKMNTEQTTASTSSTQQAAGAPQQSAPAAPAAEDNALALKIGKAVLYTAGAGAAIAAGVWAWKKWGSSSTTTTTA